MRILGLPLWVWILVLAAGGMTWRAKRKPYAGWTTLDWAGGDNLPGVGDPSAVVGGVPTPVNVLGVAAPGGAQYNTTANNGSGG